MMKRYLLALLFVLVSQPQAWAQNRIDKAVEQHSTLGSSRFTSAVERDPKTRAVQKVVKVLETRHGSKLVSLFKEEMRSDKYEKSVRTNDSNDRQMLVLTCGSEQQTRIYMLDYAPSAHGNGNVKVTIIIKNK